MHIVEIVKLLIQIDAVILFCAIISLYVLMFFSRPGVRGSYFYDLDLTFKHGWFWQFRKPEVYFRDDVAVLGKISAYVLVVSLFLLIVGMVSIGVFLEAM